MKHTTRVFLAVLLVSSVLVLAVGCQQTDPEVAEQQRIAKEFMYNVLVTQDADAAMTYVVPLTGFGYVTKEAIESSILNDKQKKCVTNPDSLTVGPPSPNLRVPEVTEEDKAKGISERSLWIVGYSMRCQGFARDTDRSTQVFLEKVNGKWGVSKCTF